MLLLSPDINCFCGINGSGKTNLLDSIYYLSFTRSFFSSSDQILIQNEMNWFSIEGKYDRDNLEEIVRISYIKGEKKSLKVNNEEMKRFSDHIGNYPLVMISPGDIMLIHESGEERRKFMDGMISQTDRFYLNQLLSYNRTLEQRNKLLKDMAEQGRMDDTLLESYNELLIGFGTYIHKKRTEFLAEFIPVFRDSYVGMSSSNEIVDIHYESELNHREFSILMRDTATADFHAGRTTKGIHRDDLEFRIDNQPLKKYGSQGQQKSFVTSLKLAQYSILKKHTQTLPLLLLDDLFEKLDSIRLERLIKMISENQFGQLFITDTHLDRLQSLLSGIKNKKVSYFITEYGNISEI